MRLCAVLGVVGLLSIPVWAQAPQNLVPSPGFEVAAGDNGLPEGWFFVTNEGSAAKPSLVAPGYKSAKCLTIKGKCEWAVAGCAKTARKAASSYLAGGQVKYQGDGQALVKFDYFKDDQWVGEYNIGAVNAEAGDWREIRLVDDPTKFPEANFVGFAVVMAGDGQAWFDEVGLYEVPKLADGGLQPNSSFEVGLGTMPTSWAVANPENEKPVVTWTADAARSGVRGIKLKCDQSWLVVYGEPQDLDRKKTWTLSGWVRLVSGSALIKFDYASDNAWLGQMEFPAAGQPGQWTQVTGTLDTTKFPEATKVTLALAVNGQGAEADFDDVALVAQAK